MLSGTVILLVSLIYLSLLFAIAYYGYRRADARSSIIATIASPRWSSRKKLPCGREFGLTSP